MQSKNILIIEDDADAAEVLEAYLRRGKVTPFASWRTVSQGLSRLNAGSQT